VIGRLRSPGVARAITWAAALVLIAGVVAFVTVRLGQEDKGPANVGSVPTGFSSEDFDPNATVTTPKESDVPKAARIAAGEFVLAAVGRENLVKAWKLADPGLKRDCACTYKQWLTGNIPVQYFPTKGLRGASFAVNEVTPGHVILQVLLTPAKSSGLRATEFYIGLKQRAKDGPWLVDYWAPVDVIPVPAAPEG
jgi:hypothetical protein